MATTFLLFLTHTFFGNLVSFPAVTFPCEWFVVLFLGLTFSFAAFLLCPGFPVEL
jgi:hypothetical protein